jgi:hypothetical protein
MARETCKLPINRHAQRPPLNSDRGVLQNVRSMNYARDHYSCVDLGALQVFTDTQVFVRSAESTAYEKTECEIPCRVIPPPSSEEEEYHSDASK